jgi:hypothetical protein
LIDSIANDLDQWEVLEELMALRADFAIHHAIRGFDMDYEKALELVRNYSGELSAEDRERRTILIAAIENLIDFSVGAEYQMARDIPDLDFDEMEYGGMDWDSMSEEQQEELEDICREYNFTYANVENQDAEYAMIVAAALAGVLPETTLMYMTQGDERVRPWHLQYEGYTAPKSLFPDWLVPPIEHMCRCFLVEDTVFSQMQHVSAKAGSKPEMPEWFNPTFKESVAFGGRIFSDAHRYFQCEEQHRERLQAMAESIKHKYLQQ